MRNQGAARAASRVLHVQHLVKQDVFHRARRNLWTIHAAIQQNLIGPGIVTTELPAPTSLAPGDVRALQLPCEVFSVQLIEELLQIEMNSTRVRRGEPHTPAPHAVR